MSEYFSELGIDTNKSSEYLNLLEACNLARIEYFKVLDALKRAINAYLVVFVEWIDFFNPYFKV
jgi:hypothetical protein